VLTVTVNRAGRGDCILLRFGEDEGTSRSILIDSGPAAFSARFRLLLNSLQPSDAFCLTHIDSDHIGGLDRYLARYQCPRCQLWLPLEDTTCLRMSGEVPLSARQAERVRSRLAAVPHEKPRVLETRRIGQARLLFIGPSGARRETIEPNEDDSCDLPYPLSRQTDWFTSLEQLAEEPLHKDASMTNADSLVFLFEYQGVSILFTGDSTPDELEKSIALLGEGRKLDLIKLPHHGSCRNVFPGWLRRVDCRNFIISSDGAELPDKQTIAVLLRYAKGEAIRIFANHAWWERDFLTPDDLRYIDGGLLICKDIGDLPWRLA
jgi:beta-lactamase superfamily II metal-dependent hydrolase